MQRTVLPPETVLPSVYAAAHLVGERSYRAVTERAVLRLIKFDRKSVPANGARGGASCRRVRTRTPPAINSISIRAVNSLSLVEEQEGIAMASKSATKDIITLRGSAAIVSEFFGYAANSILYNRGVYPEESFARVKKYGLPMLLTQDEGVKSFISNLTSQLSEWLEAGKLQRVVLVIMSKATGEVLERWNFRIETDNEAVEKGVSREKSDKEIMREIQAIMRQIASSITYLPCLDEPCVFDVLAYTDKDCAVPFTWIESDPKLIANPQMVKLHSFDTKIHKVDTLVSYKNDEWDEA
ncbi:mitotic spindle checkpoint protein MAD2 isoform X1 [Andrographis paniculata]|uniref:mitotic spindle checkpoint protein MAD2 isoform X1 n=2 Tax=Andrographis paniculata TaxID=175694 RepID=UPI0021E6DCE1|nr:mitotic spindle checkpoint protein MAD2 isoform X1 [Andrographis paniculata]